jgi:CelD/BcsL family acetyltransferase involved in cellulose biosynthesis
MPNANSSSAKAGPPHAALCVTLTPVADPAGLEREWRALESLARPNFFLSWEWIGTFMQCVPAQRAPQVLRVRAQDSLVGLCLLWPSLERRHGFVRSRTLNLNQTGEDQFDRVTIEHNGLLAVAGQEAAVAAAVLQRLAGLGHWDEIGLAGIGRADQGAWQAAARDHGLVYRERWDKTYYFIDLDQIRASGGNYLDALSANTRYQIKRAMKLYAETGTLHCEHATSAEQALQWLRELARLHQAQWTGKGHSGAFGSDFTVRFHEQLVASAWPLGRVLLTRVSAGPRVLGYLYNFCRDKVVYNYQSGHIDEPNAKLKPGLVCHALAVQDALQRQCQTYDMLLGGGHFKASLTTATGSFHWATVQRRRLSLQLEELLRKGRDRWRAASAGSAPVGTVDGARDPKPDARAQLPAQ